MEHVYEDSYYVYNDTLEYMYEKNYQVRMEYVHKDTWSIHTKNQEYQVWMEQVQSYPEHAY